MKFFGTDIKKENKGYFGVRHCTICSALKDVDLIELNSAECVFFIPIKKLGTKRYLVCKDCGAAFEITDDLWNYYNSYENRFDKATTDQIVEKLKEIETDLKSNEINLNLQDEASRNALDLIFKNFCKIYNNPQNIEEIISVYFSS